MEPTVSPKTRQVEEVRLSDEERQLDAAAASALGESLSDFLEALERPDEGTVGRLEDLRRRA
jgi:uncharacterized protein (DUF1778 family)